MSGSKPRSLTDVLHGGELGNLVAEAKARRSTTAEISRLLPPAEAAELVGAHRESDGTLVLSMRSAAWAARVKYRHAELGTDKLKVRVAPPGQGNEFHDDD